MSRLIGFELEKICRRKIVWAGLVALIGLNLVFYIFTAMPSMGVMNDWEYRAKWYGEDEATAKKMLPKMEDMTNEGENEIE